MQTQNSTLVDSTVNNEGLVVPILFKEDGPATFTEQATLCTSLNEARSVSHVHTLTHTHPTFTAC